VKAQTQAEKDVLEAKARAEADQVIAASRREATRLAAEADAAAQRIRTEAEVQSLQRLAEAAAAYAQHPALLRLRELETLTALGGNAEARLYIGFDKHAELA
jgi:regulator of protease activity HflC (stomatin/prohibitin superfamily)